MPRSRSAALLFAGLLALGVVAACSSDPETSTSDQPAAQANSGERASTTAGDRSTTTEDSGSGGGDLSVPGLGGNAQECLEASSAYLQIVGVPLGFMGGATQEQIEQFERDLDELKAKIPSELEDDFDTVAAGYREFAEIYRTLDLSNPQTFLDPEVQAKVEEASAVLDEPAFTEAQDRIQKYFDETCAG
jgi:hypothetical protein